MGHRMSTQPSLHSLGQGRIKLGSWVCPSGNSVDVYVDTRPDSTGVYHTWLFWDEPPPLRLQDHNYYLGVILPEVMRLAQEVTGRHCLLLPATIE